MNQGEQKHFKTDAVGVDSSSSRARVRAVFVLVCVDKFLLLHTHKTRARRSGLPSKRMWYCAHKEDDLMDEIQTYVFLWEYLREIGLRTISIIDNARAWDYRLKETEFSVFETFYHAIQAIYEDSYRWFRGEIRKFEKTGDHSADLNTCIDEMIYPIRNMTVEDLATDMTFQWGEDTTYRRAIVQNLFHAVGHFSQLRNWVGVKARSTNDVKPEKTYY